MNKVKLTIAGILVAIASWLLGGSTAPNLGSIGSRDAYSYKSVIAGSATVPVVIATGSDRILGSIIIGTTHATAIRIYDSASATSSSSLIGTLKASIVEGTYTFDTAMRNGIVLDVPAAYAGTLTVTYK